MAALDTTLAQSTQLAVYGTPAQQLAALEMTRDAIDGQRRAGTISQAKAVELQQTFDNGVAVGQVLRDTRLDPHATIKRLAEPSSYPGLTPPQREQQHAHVAALLRAQQAERESRRNTQLSELRHEASTALDVFAHGSDYAGADALVRRAEALGAKDIADRQRAGREDLAYVGGLHRLPPAAIAAEAQAERSAADAAGKVLERQQKALADDLGLAYAQSAGIVPPTPLGAGDLPATASAEDRIRAAKANAARRWQASRRASEHLGAEVEPLHPDEVESLGRAALAADSGAAAFDVLSGVVLPFEDPVARGAVLNQLIEAKVLKEAQARQLERAAQPGAGLAARKLYAELTPMTNEQLNLTAAAPKAARGAATKAYDDGIGQVWVKARELIGDDAYLERYDAGRDDAEMVAAKRAQGDRRHSTAVKVGEAAEAELRQGLDYLAEDGLGYVIWPAVYDGKPVDPEHVREGLRVLRDHALTQLAADAEAEAAADPTRSGALQRTLRNKKIEKLRTDALWLPVGDGRTYALVDPVLRSPLVLAGGQTVLVDLAMVIGAGRKPAASMVTTGGF